MPRMCQTILPSGVPCRREAAPDSDLCAGCTRGNSNPRLYNLAVGQARADEVSKHGDAHNLKNELALARMLVERKYNAVAGIGEAEVAIHAGPLLDMLRKVADLATQGDALARKRGDLLDKSRVTSLADKLITCVNDVVCELIEDQKLQGEVLVTIAENFLEIIKQETQPNV